MLDIISQLPSKGSNGIRKLNELKHIVVHHEGVFRADSNTTDHLKADANYHLSRGWGRISYHYCVARAGEIYILNPLEEIAYHAGNPAYNKTSFGVVLEGDLDKQRPTSEQIKSLWGLLDGLCVNRPDLPGVIRKNIRTHREVRLKPTACPSEIIHKLIEAYRA